MRVVVFGTYDAAVHPRAAVLVEGLTRQGFDVTEVNARLEIGTAMRVAILQQPWRIPLLFIRLLRCWTRLVSATWGPEDPDVVLVPYLGHFDVLLARVRWPRRTVVLDHLVSATATARDRGETGRAKLWLLHQVDAMALRSADIVLVDTAESAERLPEAARPRAVVVPVGATAEWFVKTDRARSSGSTPLRVVFFGSFTPLQGTRTIGRALALLDEGTLETTLVGTGQDFEDVRNVLAGRSDVNWVNWIPIEDLPATVAQHDVCLGIFGDSDKAVSVVPTKVYQGAATGCAVVTSDTMPQRRALGNAAVFVPPADAHALAAALQLLAERPEEVVRLRRAAVVRARDFTALRAVAPLAELLCARDSGSSRSGPTPASGAAS